MVRNGILRKKVSQNLELNYVGSMSVIFGYFRSFSVIFGYFRLFSAIFGYFRLYMIVRSVIFSYNANSLRDYAISLKSATYNVWWYLASTAIKPFFSASSLYKINVADTKSHHPIKRLAPIYHFNFARMRRISSITDINFVSDYVC